MIFKAVFGHWKESLGIFQKSEFKVFILLVLNTFVRSVRIVFKNFWWLFFASCIIPPLIIPLMFAVFLAIRPSVERKDFFYFTKYAGKIWGFLLIFSINVMFPLAFLAAPSGILFFMDQESNFKNVIVSMYRGLKLLLHFLPVCFCISFTHMFVFLLLVKRYFIAESNLAPIMGNVNIVGLSIGSPIKGIIGTTALLFVNVLFLSAHSIYYTKIKHGYHNLFFK
jgi:hypothetical protein